MDSSRNGAASPGVSGTTPGTAATTPSKGGGFFRTPLNINPVSVTQKSSGYSSQASSVSSPPSSSGGGPEKKSSGSRFIKVLVPESSPRRNSLFNTFKAGLKGKKDQSPRDSPTGNHFLSTLCEASPSYAPVSPRRLSLFDQLTSFRQRSKSDCRAKKLATRANEANDRRAQKAAADALSVYATIHNGQRPPLTTIASVEEERLCGSCSGGTTPSNVGPGLPMLYVDTQLANSPAVSASSANQCCLSARNPNEINKEYEERRRFFSGSSRPYYGDRRYSLLMNDVVHKSGAGPVSPSRAQGSLDLGSGEKPADDKEKISTAKLILFKNSNVAVGVEICEATNLERREMIFYHLLKANRSFNILPNSTRVVVLHASLQVKKAFPALLANSIRAASLIDNKRRFIGMLTITDFIQIFFHYETTGQNIVQELQTNLISTWKDIQNIPKKDEDKNEFISIGSEQSLYHAIELMKKKRVHRIPVLDEQTNNIIYILTYKRLFRYLYTYVVGVRPRFLRSIPSEMGIGTYENIISVTMETNLRETLELLMTNKISSVPIVNGKNEPINIYSKFDFISFLQTENYTNLNIPMTKAIEIRKDYAQTDEMLQKPGFLETLATCEDTDSLWVVMGIFHDYQVHRVVVVDRKLGQMVGIISLSDLFNFLVLVPPGEDRPPTPIEVRIKQDEEDEKQRLQRLKDKGRRPFPREIYGISTVEKSGRSFTS